LKFPPDLSGRLSGPNFKFCDYIGLNREKIAKNRQKYLFLALFWHRLSRLSIRPASQSQIEAPIWLPGRGPDREPDRFFCTLSYYTINNYASPPWPLFRQTPWRRHQIMAPLIPNAMRRPQAVGIAYAVVGSLAWRGEMRGVKK